MAWAEVRPRLLQVLTSNGATEDNTTKLSAGLDRPERSGSSNVIAWVTAVLLSAAVIALDRWVRDVSISLFLVTVVALALGSVWRERAWRWALIVGLTLPAAVVGSSVLHHDPLAPTLLYLIAFVPAFVGAYMGAFLNKMVSALRGKED